MVNMSVGRLLNKKREAKKFLAKLLSFSHKKPLLGIFLDRELSKESEEKLITFLKAVSVVDVQVVVLADSNLAAIALANVIPFEYSRPNREALLEASDMALCFSFSDVEEMLIHGIIPLSLTRPEVSDYDPNNETGNSFIYKEEDPWYIFAALVRARETFKFPYDWKHIVRQGVESVCGDAK